MKYVTLIMQSINIGLLNYLRITTGNSIVFYRFNLSSLGKFVYYITYKMDIAVNKLYT